MIVAALEIENYKQYSGSHRIEFPEQGIVAVTGPNGAGKTTLFEAIEWCLYCPRSIPQATVPPHDGVGRTVVRVVLQDSDDGMRYVVQRELRSSGTQAEVYREDEPEQSIVQGTREVSRYVASKLIGLSHGAFVSTFFTRQKELQFFADRSATDRRIEVGRLLGLEAVREAQKEIGEGRTAARSRADSLREEYERRLDDRNLEGEKATAASAVTEAEALELEAEQEALHLTATAELARGELERLRALQEADAALGQELTKLAGESAACVARRDAAASELKRLETRASERAALAAIAASVEPLSSQVATFETQRERSRRRRELDAIRASAADAGTRIWGRLEQIVDEHREAAAGLTNWALQGADAVLAARQLNAVAAALDPAEGRARVELLHHAARTAAGVEESTRHLAGYRQLRDSLAAKRDGLLADGDPGAALEDALRSLRESREAEHVARSGLAAARVEHADDEKLLATLRQHVDDPICPTCTRPLGPHDAERLVQLLDAKIARLVEDEHDLADQARAAAERTTAAEQAESTARGLLEEIRVLAERLADGQRMIDEAEARHGEAGAALQAALAAIGSKDVPTEADIAAARRCADRTQRIAGLAGLLDRLGDEAESARDAQMQAEASIRDLGDCLYDAGAHEAALESLRGARRAAAQVERIDIELASQERYAEQHASEVRALAELAARQTAVAEQRAESAFDPATLRRAIEFEQGAHATGQAARDRHLTARTAARDARDARQRLEAEHNLLQQLVEDADRSNREADDLTRMYEEFGEFDRYVALHVGPLLAETTERMLSQVTNGKYNHVQFDESYGIDVYDGDESFPLGGFSGGERDVVALCARLALSEVVGASAVRPPRFLVLDEVFGSLDSERRGQLLETLGTLMHSGHFRQMFIISHVDDVQQSPVMNEAWIIEERDGVSRVVRPESLFGISA